MKSFVRFEVDGTRREAVGHHLYAGVVDADHVQAIPTRFPTAPIRADDVLAVFKERCPYQFAGANS